MNTQEKLNELLKCAKLNVKNVTIIFLANVKGISTNANDYSDSSILTEFLSIDEYNELLNACQNFGFYTLSYFDTNEFVKDFLNNKFANHKLIVFEGSQKGIGRGRDSLLPSFCDLASIKHTGPNAYVNSICTNKYHWTKLLESHNISVPQSWRYNNGKWLNNEFPEKKVKLIAKPCYECASIGIHKECVGFFSTNYEKYLKTMSSIYMQPLIVQKFINGYEVEVPVIIYEQNPYILQPVVLYKNKGYSMEDAFLDFDDIYNDDYNFCLLESINTMWNDKIKEEVYKIVELLELERYTRIDFRLTNNGDTYVTDINSYPHIVSHSSFAYAFEQLGIAYDNILPCIIGNILQN